MLLVGLVNLFNSCQLHISYTKYIKLLFKVFAQEQSLSLFAWLHRGRGHDEKRD